MTCKQVGILCSWTINYSWGCSTIHGDVQQSTIHGDLSSSEYVLVGNITAQFRMKLPER